MSEPSRERSSARPPLFGALPTTGIWTAFGLSRSLFLAIFFGSVALFVFLDGPVWEHLHDAHMRRILVSYAAIPGAVALALWWQGRLGLRELVAASAVLGLLKLVATAGLLALLAMAAR